MIWFINPMVSKLSETASISIKIITNRFGEDNINAEAFHRACSGNGQLQKTFVIHTPNNPSLFVVYCEHELEVRRVPG